MANRKPGHRVADDHRPGRPHVEARAVAHRLGDAEGNRDQVHQQRRPESQGDGHRQLVHHQLHHRAVAEEAVAEVEAQEVPHHEEEALVGGLVEAELALDLLDELGVDAAGAAVRADGAASGIPRLLLRSLNLPLVAAAAEPFGGRHVGLLELRQELLHRPSRRGVDDHEVQHHDAEQRRNDQQQPAYDVGEHEPCESLYLRKKAAFRPPLPPGRGQPPTPLSLWERVGVRVSRRSGQLAVNRPCASPPVPPPSRHRPTRRRTAHPAWG